MNEEEKCESCGLLPDDAANKEPACEDCCEHSDCDDHCCLICGKDMAESFSAAAFDRYKDKMKYGD